MPQEGLTAPLDAPRGEPSPDREVRTVGLGDFLRVLVRGAPFAAVVTALAVVAAIVLTRSQDPVYSASVAMVATQTAPRYEDIDVVVPPVVDPSVYRTAIYDGGVLRDALERVEGRPLGARELEAASEAVRVTIESHDVSSVVRVFARDSSPQRAARIVNAVADELVAWDRSRARQRLEQSIAALERAIRTIDAELAGEPPPDAARQGALASLRAQRVDELGLTRAAAASAVAVALIEPMAAADPPERAVGPRPVLNTAVAIVLGLVAGYGLLLISWMTNPRVGGREDLARFAQRPVLAVFPRRVRGQERLSEEGTSWLRTRLAARRKGEGCQVLVIAGLRSAEDKDGVAVGLAESFARGGDATLLIDADLRAGRATAWLGIAAGRATPYDDAVAGDPARPYAPVSVVVDRDRSFDFLPAPTSVPHPVDRLVRLFDEERERWRAGYDVVIVDAAPLLPHADALAVAADSDGVVLCARRGRTSRADVERALALLAEQGAPVLGTVLTHAGPESRATAVGPASPSGQRAARPGAKPVRTNVSRRS